LSFEASRQQDLAVLHPVIRESVKRVQEQLDEEKLPFRVFEAYRTPERQRLLYRQGRDVPGDIVTKARPWDSYHQYGLAVDFVLYISGSWSWKSTGQYAKMWQRLHVIGRQHGLEPLSWESPHLQYAKTSIDKLKAGDYPTGGDEAWAEQIAAAIAGWAGAEDAPPAPQGAILRPAIETKFDDDESDVQTFGSVSDPKASGFKSRPELGLTEDVIQGAQASDRLWGVPASVTLAQFILESAFGKKMPPGSNNPFGIKAKGDQPFVKARTIEHVHGREQVAYANFRKFSSFDEAFAQHGRLLATSSHYTAAMSVRDDPLAFANALTGIYATDPKYGSSLIKLIGQYELTSYDVSTSNRSGISFDTGDIKEEHKRPSGAKFGDEGEAVRALQQMLKTAGYSVGAVDGKFGSLTRGALLAFQADNGIQPTGLGDDKTVAVLNKSPPRPLDRERLSATENDLKERGSRTVIEAKRTKLLGWITGILGAVGIGNSAVVNSSGSNATAAPGLEAFLTDLQTFLANPTSPTSIAQLGEIRQNAAAVAEAVKAFKDSDLPTVVQKLEPLLSSVAPAHTLQTTRTVFDLITPIFQGSPNLEPVAQGLASIAASFIPGLGGSVASIAIGFIAHYLGSKISQARVQEHREGSNLDR
jgi:peptidoglycan hydrolase-like protein with peptidoglycan-binding domain